MTHPTVDSTVDTTTHSPSPFQLSPVGHPCLSGNWVPTSPPCRPLRMDGFAALAGVVA